MYPVRDTSEERKDGRPPGRSWLPAVVLTAIMVVLLALVADITIRHTTFETLTSKTELAEDRAIWDPLFREERYFESCVAPEWDNMSEQERRDALLVLREATSRAHAELLRYRGATRDIIVMPWHRSLGRAKARIEEHWDVWLGSLDRTVEALSTSATSEDATAAAIEWLTVQEGDSAAIHGTYLAARDAFFEADPPLDWFGLETRSEAIFDDEARPTPVPSC